MLSRLQTPGIDFVVQRVSRSTNGSTEDLHRNHPQWVSLPAKTLSQIVIRYPGLQMLLLLVPAIKYTLPNHSWSRWRCPTFWRSYPQVRDGKCVFVSRGSTNFTFLGSDSEIHYLQSQNGNVYSSYDSFGSLDRDAVTKATEFGALKRDVPADVAWCSEAFGE